MPQGIPIARTQAIPNQLYPTKKRRKSLLPTTKKDRPRRKRKLQKLRALRKKKTMLMIKLKRKPKTKVMLPHQQLKRRSQRSKMREDKQQVYWLLIVVNMLPKRAKEAHTLKELQQSKVL